MATIKITDLPELLSGSATGSDVIPIVDVSADITKKITIEQLSGLVGGGGGGGEGAGIPTGIDNCITELQPQSTCTQVIVGGHSNCMDATGFAATFPSINGGPNFNTCFSGSGFNFIGGGTLNFITGSFGQVSCGWLGAGNVIVGGAGNVIRGIETTCIFDKHGGNFIGGGNMNYIVHSSNSAAYGPTLNTISGGYCNQMYHSGCTGCYLSGNTISGGYLNEFSGDGPQDFYGNSVIAGGYLNIIGDGTANTISGGQRNEILSLYSYSSTYISNAVTSGGSRNKLHIINVFNSLANNCVKGEFGGSSQLRFTCSGYSGTNTIAGGYCNATGAGYNNSIGGGVNNNIGQKCGAISNDGAIANTIGGGEGNVILVGETATTSGDPYRYSDANNISGGNRNSIRHSRGSAIAGGTCNDILNSSGSFIAGEFNSVIHTKSHIIGNSITSRATGSLHVNNLLLETGSIPTADPGIPGMLYIAGGALKVSGCL